MVHEGLVYPITLAEMGDYQRDADAYFKDDEHERLKEFLALRPESGDILPDTGGVRRLHWPITSDGSGHDAVVIYFYRDLNMPLYLLALYKKGEAPPKMTAEYKREIERLVAELVAQHSKGFARIVRQEAGVRFVAQENGGSND